MSPADKHFFFFTEEHVIFLCQLYMTHEQTRVKSEVSVYLLPAGKKNTNIAGLLCEKYLALFDMSKPISSCLFPLACNWEF